MAHRRVQPEVQQMFEKYVNNSHHVRRLDREGSLQLLQKEFRLSLRSAESVFHYFGFGDKQNEFSLWEFQHFYNLAGKKAAELAEQFIALDTENKDYLDRVQAETALQNMTTADGKPLEAKDVEFILKTSKDENKIFLGDFIAIMYRVRMYRK